MDSNTLTIVVFLLASGLLLGVEAVKTEGKVRYTFAGGAGAFVLLALFWVPLANAFPVAARQVASVAQNPSSWFILLIVIFLVAREWWGKPFRKKPTKGSAPDKVMAGPYDVREYLDGLLDGSVKAELAISDLNAKFEALHARLGDLRGDLEATDVTANTALEKGDAAQATADFMVNKFNESGAAVQTLEQRLDRMDERIAAMRARIRLDYQEGVMNALDPHLYFPDAVGIREVDWSVWEQRQKEWVSAAHQWAYNAEPYAPNAREVIEHTPSNSYYGDWTFADSDLPDANTIHKYKTFCIMRRNFADVRQHVDGKVMVTSFG